MRLIRLAVQGYRRFEEPATLETDDRLIALVGPNEAGKTSLLQALRHLDHDEAIPNRERTLGSGQTAELKATFALEDADRQVLSKVFGGQSVHQVDLTKHQDGVRQFTFHPELRRDLAPRTAATAALRSIAGDPALSAEWSSAEAPWDEGRLNQALEILDADVDRLVPEQFNTLRELLASIEGLTYAPPADENEPVPESDAEGLRATAASLRAAIANDELPHPSEYAAALLHEVLPRFVEFTTDDRALRNSYAFDELLSPNRALSNVAYVAGLNLDSLHGAITSGDGALTEEFLDEAHQRLETEFSQSRWRQGDLEVRIRNTADALQFIVRNKKDKPFTYVRERSAGLQWFVALTCFLHRHAGSHDAIVLIDEAEQHLHYDAQADLVALLDSQELASQVVYSTHSAGCLPPDLGRGVRAIIPDPDPARARSTIETGFWGEGPGFSRLLLGMGASMLAFTVPRRLAIAEGVTEAILLPTLLREANGLDALEYQIAPGLANTAPDDYPLLVTHAGLAVFVVDGDDEGNRYEHMLRAQGVDGSKIFNFGKLSGVPDLNVEELVDPTVYVDAVNDALRTQTGTTATLTVPDLPPTKWAYHVERVWCPSHQLSAPSKRVVAQRVVDRARRPASGSGSQQQVVNAARSSVLVELHRLAMSEFPDDAP